MDNSDSSRAGASEVDRTVPVTDELATEAVKLFSSQKYAESVDVLNQLVAKREGDPKVLHNLAISEYYRDGCSDPINLLNVLCELKGISLAKRSQELAHSSYNQLDSTMNGNTVSGSKENVTNLNQLPFTDTGCDTYANEFDTCIITMNTATLLYNFHEYARAFSIMEPLYQNLDPYDEPIILHGCILFLDIALAANEATKAASVIRYLETFLGGDSNITANSTDNGITTQNQVLKTSIDNISSSDSNSKGHDNSLSRTVSDDALEYENLYSTLDDNSQKQTLGKPSLNRAATVSSPSDLKLKIQMYKIRLLLLTRNLKAAKREIKLAMNSVRGSDSSTELLLKSQVEYSCGNYRKAIKLLMATCSNQTDPKMLSIYNNNLGCIHYSQKTPHTSGLFFSKALRNSISVRKGLPLKLSTFSVDKLLLISYNFGVQNLTCGKPLSAARYFGKAALTFHDHPLLWLRLAECCFLAFEKGILGKSSANSVIVNVVGSGTWRRLAVDNLKSANNPLLKEVNAGECKISLPFARYCLRTALLLLDRNEEKAKTAEANKGILEASASAYEGMKRKENHMIKQAVLAGLAYNELLQENPLRSLSFSKMLLELPECSRIYMFLGHIYAAEALCKLNRVEEAVKHLSVYLGNDEVVLPYSDDDRTIWSVKRGVFSEYEDMKSNVKGYDDSSMFVMASEAKGSIYLNMVGIYASRGEFENARRFASRALLMLPNNPKALLAAVYVDLLEKKMEKAILKLKSFNHVSYVSTNVTVS